MKLTRIGGLILLAAATALPALAAEPAPNPLIEEFLGHAEAQPRAPAEIEAAHAQILGLLLPQMGSKDLNEQAEAQRAYTKICFRAARPGAEAERAAACKAILARLKPDLPQPALLCLFEQLEHIGRAESVAALAPFLDSTDLLARERARRALQANPAPEASGPLLKALQKADSPEWRVALLNALAYRRDAASARAILPLVASEDEGVRVAAAGALARLADEAAANPLAAATAKPQSVGAWINTVDAYLLLADNLAAEGKKDAALRMYRNLLKATGHVKIGAIIGLGRAGGADELPAIFDALADPDPQVRSAATGAIELLPVEVATRAITEKAKAATPEMKVVLLKVLARHGGKSVLPTLVAAAADPAEGVRIAAYECMATVGEAAAVAPLLDRLPRTQGKELDAVRLAIGRIPGDGVDQAVVQAMAAADGKLKVELIRILGDRKAEAGVPVLLKAAADPALQAEAVKALGSFAGEPAVAPLVTLFVGAQDAAARQAMEKALAAVCGRVEDADKRDAPLLAALPQADAKARCTLLRVLGRGGSDKALAAVQAALKDKEPEVQDAAARVLADWPDAKPANDLLALAGSAEKLVHRVLALQGYVRMVGLPSDRPAAETLKMYEAAMKVATRPEDKKLVLAGVAEVGDLDALKMAEAYLADETLKAEAVMATCKIATAVAGVNRDEAKAALRKVIAGTDNKDIQKQAQDAINQIEKFEDYITAWQVSGPYTAKGKKGPDYHDLVFPPEKEGDTAAAWKTMPPSNDPKIPGLMDLGTFLKGDDRVAYLRTRIWSPRDQEVQMQFGSDDGAKVWLDSKLVLAADQPRSCVAGQDKVKLALKQGWNPLLVKVWQGGVDWGASLRFRALDGSSLAGLKADPAGK